MNSVSHQDWAAMGLERHSPWDTSPVTVPELSPEEQRREATRQRNRDLAKARSAMVRAANRVNPEVQICSPFVPKSIRSPR